MLYLPFEWYEMNKMLGRSRDQVKEYKTMLFIQQVNYVSQNIPFYKNYFKREGLDSGDFKELKNIEWLPVIDKQYVHQNKEQFFNPNTPKAELYSCWTSGSTGEPFRSFFDKKSWIRKKYLSKLRAKFYCGVKWSDRIGIVFSESEDVYSKLNRRLIQNLPFLRTKYVTSLEHPKESLRKLIEFKPDILYGPHSYIFQMAEEFEKLERTELPVRLIFTSSELLSKPAVKRIRSIFNADVLDIYGSSEFKEVSWECPEHQGYHINEDEVHVEILDKQNKPLTSDQGFIVLSDFRNKGMPLLRYKIKDTGSFISGICACGCSFARMSPKGGRASDYVRLSSGEKVSPFLIEDAIELVPDIKQYQVVQKEQNLLWIGVVTLKKDHELIERQILKEFAKILSPDMKYKISFVEKVDIEENGKFKLVKSDFL